MPGFNLTANLVLKSRNLKLKPIVAQIKRELGSIKAEVDVKVAKNAGSQIQKLIGNVKALNTELAQTDALSSRISTSLSSISSVQTKTSNTTNKLRSDLAKQTKTITNVGQAAQKSSGQIEEFGRVSGLAVRRFSGFTIGTSVIFGLINAISDAISEAIEFEKELIKVAQVTNRSLSQLKGLTNTISELSSELGVSSLGLVKVARTLAQAGLSARDTQTALRSLAKTELAPTFDDITRTTEGAIAAINQFGISVDNLEGILGSINAVAGQFAVESDDIIRAIRRTGGIFAVASGDLNKPAETLNELIAVFTAVRSTTRESADSIATGLRTIFTRLQRPQTIRFLQDLGIELKDVEGKFVGPFQAISNLSDALNRLDSRSPIFAEITEEIGGLRQIGKLIPAIKNFEQAQRALNVARAGTGSLTTDAIKAQQGLSNQITKVREDFLALLREISQTTTFKVLTKSVLGLASGLITLADAFKGLLPFLTALAAFKGISTVLQFGRGFGRGIRAGDGGASSAGEAIGQTVTGRASEAQSNANRSALSSNTKALESLKGSVERLSQLLNSRGTQRLGLQAGGLVPGTGNRDTVPAMLTPGEFVLNKAATQKVGAANLQKFQQGGTVQDLPNFVNGEALFGAVFLRDAPGKTSGKQRSKTFQGAGTTTIPEVGEVPFRLVTATVDKANSSFVQNFDENIRGSLNQALSTNTQNLASKLRAQFIGAEFRDGEGILDSIVGTVFERALVGIGAPFDGAATDSRSNFDFPTGLGGLAQNFLTPDLTNIPTEAKRTKDQDAFKDIKQTKIPNFLRSFFGLSGSTKVKSRTDKEATKSLNELTAFSTREQFEGALGRKGRFVAKRLANNDDFFNATPERRESIVRRQFGDDGVSRIQEELEAKGLKLFRQGGSVEDRVPALLTPGEFVFNKEAVKRFGVGNLIKLNKEGAKGFNQGGFVGGIQRLAPGDDRDSLNARAEFRREISDNRRIVKSLNVRRGDLLSQLDQSTDLDIIDELSAKLDEVESQIARINKASTKLINQRASGTTRTQISQANNKIRDRFGFSDESTVDSIGIFSSDASFKLKAELDQRDEDTRFLKDLFDGKLDDTDVDIHARLEEIESRDSRASVGRRNFENSLAHDEHLLELELARRNAAAQPPSISDNRLQNPSTISVNSEENREALDELRVLRREEEKRSFIRGGRLRQFISEARGADRSTRGLTGLVGRAFSTEEKLDEIDLGKLDVELQRADLKDVDRRSLERQREDIFRRREQASVTQQRLLVAQGAAFAIAAAAPQFIDNETRGGAGTLGAVQGAAGGFAFGAQFGGFTGGAIGAVGGGLAGALSAISEFNKSQALKKLEDATTQAAEALKKIDENASLDVVERAADANSKQIAALISQSQVQQDESQGTLGTILGFLPSLRDKTQEARDIATIGSESEFNAFGRFVASAGGIGTEETAKQARDIRLTNNREFLNQLRTAGQGSSQIFNELGARGQLGPDAITNNRDALASVVLGDDRVRKQVSVFDIDDRDELVNTVIEIAARFGVLAKTLEDFSRVGILSNALKSINVQVDFLSFSMESFVKTLEAGNIELKRFDRTNQELLSRLNTGQLAGPSTRNLDILQNVGGASNAQFIELQNEIRRITPNNTNPLEPSSLQTNFLNALDIERILETQLPNRIADAVNEFNNTGEESDRDVFLSQLPKKLLEGIPQGTLRSQSLIQLQEALADTENINNLETVLGDVSKILGDGAKQTKAAIETLLKSRIDAEKNLIDAVNRRSQLLLEQTSIQRNIDTIAVRSELAPISRRRRLSVEEQSREFNTGLRTLTGGATSPADISAQIQAAERQILGLESADFASLRTTFGSRGFGPGLSSTLTDDALVEFRDIRIGELNTDIANARKALTALANDTSNLAAIQKELAEIERRRADSQRISQGLLTQNPFDLIRNLQAASAVASGQRNLSQEDFRRAFAGVSTLQEILRARGSDETADDVRTLIDAELTKRFPALGELLPLLGTATGDTDRERTLEGSERAAFNTIIEANKSLKEFIDKTATSFIDNATKRFESALDSFSPAEIRADNIASLAPPISEFTKAVDKMDKVAGKFDSAIDAIIDEANENDRVETQQKKVNDAAAAKARRFDTALQGIEVRNRGGVIPGSGNTDSVPAMLTPGEFVINKRDTKKNLPLLRALNSGGKVKGFIDGGEVGRGVNRLNSLKDTFDGLTTPQLLLKRKTLLRSRARAFRRGNGTLFKVIQEQLQVINDIISGNTRFGFSSDTGLLGNINVGGTISDAGEGRQFFRSGRERAAARRETILKRREETRARLRKEREVAPFTLPDTPTRRFNPVTGKLEDTTVGEAAKRDAERKAARGVNRFVPGEGIVNVSKERSEAITAERNNIVTRFVPGRGLVKMTRAEAAKLDAEKKVLRDRERVDKAVDPTKVFEPSDSAIRGDVSRDRIREAASRARGRLSGRATPSTSSASQFGVSGRAPFEDFTNPGFAGSSVPFDLISPKKSREPKLLNIAGNADARSRNIALKEKLRLKLEENNRRLLGETTDLAPGTIRAPSASPLPDFVPVGPTTRPDNIEISADPKLFNPLAPQPPNILDSFGGSGSTDDVNANSNIQDLIETGKKSAAFSKFFRRKNPNVFGPTREERINIASQIAERNAASDTEFARQAQIKKELDELRKTAPTSDPNFGAGFRGFNLGGSVLKKFGSGGSVDNVPALLTPGEFVVNNKAASENQILLEMINKGDIPKFQNGGVVGAFGSALSRATGTGTSSGSGAGIMQALSRSSQQFGASAVKFTQSASQFNTSVSEFVKSSTAFGTAVQALQNINIPNKVEMTGNHKVEVIINGAQILNNLLEGPLGNLVAEQIQQALDERFTISGEQRVDVV